MIIQNIVCIVYCIRNICENNVCEMCFTLLQFSVFHGFQERIISGCGHQYEAYSVFNQGRYNSTNCITNTVLTLLPVSVLKYYLYQYYCSLIY